MLDNSHIKNQQKKRYLVEIFIKRCIDHKMIKEQIKFYIKLMMSNSNIGKSSLDAIKNKYSIEKYLEGLKPIVEKHFSTDEIISAIDFFSSEVGKKIKNCDVFLDMSKYGELFIRQMEQDFLKYKDGLDD